MKESENKNPKQRRGFDILFFLIVIVAIVGVVLLINNLAKAPTATVNYNKVNTWLDSTSCPITSQELTVTPAGGDYNYELYTVSGKYKEANMTNEASFKLVVTSSQLETLLTKLQGKGYNSVRCENALSETGPRTCLSPRSSYYSICIVSRREPFSIRVLRSRIPEKP